ncbi:reverse transcriptase domain-containing protein, partial [Tanacetum coccineum]
MVTVGSRWWRWLWRDDDGTMMVVMMVSVVMHGGCHGEAVVLWHGGVVAGGDGRRVAGSELVDRGDPEMELVFGVGRKIPPEKISGGGVVVAGGGDSEDSTVTYTDVSSPFANLPNIRSPGVDGPPVMPEDPYAYVVATFQAPPSPDYVSGPEYPPSPEFVPEPAMFLSQILRGSREDDDEDPEEDPTDYLADGGDDGDDEDESSDDDEDEDVDIETKPFETPKSLPPREEVERLLAMPTPPASPLSNASSHSSIPSPQYTRFSPPLLSRDETRFLTPRKRLGISLGPGYEVGESSSAAARPIGGLRSDYGFVATMDREIMRDLERYVNYRITDTWDEMLVDMLGAPATEDTEMGRRMTEFTTRVRQDTDEIYTRDRRAHARTARLMDEARMSREAWGRYMDAGDLARAEETDGDYRDVGGRPQETKAVHRGTESAEETSDSDDRAMINQGVTAALAARDADRNTNGDDSHISGAGAWKELPVYLNGLKEWSLFSTSVIVQLRIKSSLLLALSIQFSFNHVASKPKTMQDAVEIATELIDKKIRTFAERRIESKRKFEDTSRNTQNQQQQQNKRQNTGRAYTAGSGEKKQYGGSKPLCSKCNYHHDDPCAPKCHKCNKVGHFACDCRSMTNANNANNQRGTGSGQKHTCFECGAQGHFKRECPKMKNNNNQGNQVGGGNSPAKVYAVGHARINPDSNIMTGTFLLNNHYTSILFDTGADRSFVSTAFSSQIDITPTELDHYYDVELADGRIIGLNTILRGCILNLLNHPFNIDLMPVELGSFDAIIGMD